MKSAKKISASGHSKKAMKASKGLFWFKMTQNLKCKGMKLKDLNIDQEIEVHRKKHSKCRLHV